ncbi:isoprenyl transferase [Cohaesibacter celericrescens]|uniref:Isoprenyl transferase n=1 Tax=Cohaesibacter celericrescens TaxID=2067669 RepID=A0A2N5XSL9_9HYPH|nr:isoprenyl transferase [Cohaesibacter celericrescens]PLW77494.1 di-trans,poly-cis-decaprenylcistransferase [Cohaesibacter celericrescens]
MGGQSSIAEAPDLSDMVIPRHLAVIMDGNGRWAQERKLSRTQGHRQGVVAVREIVANASQFGIRYLTLFSFSSENWSRPETEVRDLMGLLKMFIRKDLATLHKQNVRVLVIGGRIGLPSDIVALLQQAEEKTADNSGLTLVIAFNYGSRQEMTDMVRHLAREVKEGRLDPDAITEDLIATSLYSAGVPDPDVILRTSGEQRLSNFLLWQAAYSEFVFVDCYWPDFDKAQLELALVEYGRRNRRFGGLSIEDDGVRAKAVASRG